MMNEELEQHIAQRTDEELYDMLHVHREDWTPEALEVAQREWDRRDLSSKKTQEIRSEVESENLAAEAVADEPLSWMARLFFFVFNFTACLGIPQALWAEAHYRGRGYERKYRECWKWMGYGFLFHLVAFLAMAASGIVTLLVDKLR